MIKSVIARLFGAVGLQLSRARPTGYEYLLDVPRYRETTVTLLGRPFRVADSLSFYYSHREIFVNEIYRFSADGDSPRILDCGANYGASVLYFKRLYPRARVVAIEADPGIFAILQQNVGERGLSNVTLLNKAVCTADGPVDFYSEGADGGRLHPLAGASRVVRVDPVRLDDLIEDRADFLKMDIEGAEVEVILGAKALDKVARLFIEYHSFHDSPQMLGPLLELLGGKGFRCYLQTMFCPPHPFVETPLQHGMDLQINISAVRQAGRRS